MLLEKIKYVSRIQTLRGFWSKDF